MSRTDARRPASTAAPAPGPDDPRIQCPLCGYRFVHGVEVCGSCGISGGCGTLGCPHCGYALPPRSAVLDFFHRWARRLTGRHALDSTREES
ncbi:MAG: hypothetical protein ACE5IK_06540 [Acidobacteriota bacterium]